MGTIEQIPNAFNATGGIDWSTAEARALEKILSKKVVPNGRHGVTKQLAREMRG